MLVAGFYVGVINLLGFALMVADKRFARIGARRVPEKTLFFLAWLGGATGVYIGMKFARHKTRHGSFALGIPALIIVNLAVVYFIQRT